MDQATLSRLREKFTDRLQVQAPMSGYTSAHIGGTADALLIVHSCAELVEAAGYLWKIEVPFIILGGGSNVLVSDLGVREMVIINRARTIRFIEEAGNPAVWAESGVLLNDLARKAARKGLAGLEWATSIPGTLGGAVYGNAGAFDGTTAGNVISVEMLHSQRGRETWPVERMGYTYRSSVLKAHPQPIVVLAATLQLTGGDREEIRKKMEQFSSRRRSTQPPGAGMGSIFKNPPGDRAGRLIEAAGLKGTRLGNAQISSKHANFFVNHGRTRALDFMELITLARKEVQEKFGILLELEIQLIGEWNNQENVQA